jgi:hypothetical protein
VWVPAISEAVRPHTCVKLFLLLGIKNVDELDPVLSSICRDGNEVIPAFDVRHVRAQLEWTTVAVSIEPKLLARIGDFAKVELASIVANVGDAMREERFALRANEPVTALDPSKGDVAQLIVIALRWTCKQSDRNQK